MPTLPDDYLDRRIVATFDSIPLLENRRTIERYLGERRANGDKTGSLANYAVALRGLCEFLGPKLLESVAKEDLVAYVNKSSRERIWRSFSKNGHVTITRKQVRLSPTTLACRKIILRMFFKWLRGTDEYPPEVKNLRPNRPRDDAIPTDKLIGAEDMRRLLQAHPSAREKALLAVLHDSGLRAGELCALNLGSVQFDQYGAVLTLPKRAAGLKTGARRVRLFESGPFLQAWWEAHPEKGNPKAPLFISMSRRAPGVRMTTNALWKFCHDAGVKAKLDHEVHPHLFRHSAATEKARLGWREAEMRNFFGWARGSDMPSVYVHLAGQDYEEMELERRGLKQKGERAFAALAPRVCRACKSENLATATFCQACRNPVSPEAEAEIELQRRAQLKEELARLLAAGLKETIAEQVRALSADNPGRRMNSIGSAARP